MMERELIKLRNQAILLLLTAGAGVAAYYLLLTDEARTSLKGAMGSVTDSYKRLYGAFEDLRGIVMEEEDATPLLPNREAAIRQWDALGF